MWLRLILDEVYDNYDDMILSAQLSHGMAAITKILAQSTKHNV